MKKYFVITNEEYIDDEHYITLNEAKKALCDCYTHRELHRLFNENHISMIEKNVWNKDKKEYEVESYTPFIATDSGLRFFRTTKDWNLANRELKEYRQGII